MTGRDDLEEIAGTYCDDDRLPQNQEAKIATLQARLIQCANERDAALARMTATEGLVTAAEAVLHDFGRFERKALSFPDVGRVEVWSPERAVVNTSSMHELQQALLRLAQLVTRG
jgi:hypothetical protein